MQNMENKELLVETSDDEKPIGCGAYNYENGYCNDTNKPCNMCFVDVVFPL